MPVALKLSKEFYERVGEQVANELVDAFNQVDATYRSDLKEMNESNFARYDAKMDARFAQFDAKMDARFAQFDAKIEARFAQFEARFSQFDARFAQFEARQDARDAKFEAQIERGFNAQARFILLSWATFLAAVVAGIVALK
jgi:hypothetical protein